MPSPGQYQSLLANLVKRHKHDVTLQRLMFAAANLRDGSPRLEVLTTLAANAKLDREVLTALATDADPAVRALAWSPRQRWTADEVSEMTRTETVAVVRMQALGHPDLPADTYTRAAMPIGSRKKARQVLAHLDVLPVSVVDACVRCLGAAAPANVSTSERSLVERALEVPGVAIAVVSDPQTPYWVALLAAAHVDVDDATVGAMFATWLADDVAPDTDAQVGHDMASMWVSTLAKGLVARTDLSADTLRLAYLWCRPAGEFVALRAAADLASLGPAAIGLRRWNATYTDNYEQLREAWRSTPEDQRSAALARLALTSTACPVDVMGEAVDYLDGDWGPDVVRELAQETLAAQQALPRWMVEYPEDALQLLRVSGIDLVRLGRAVRLLDSERRGFATLVAREVLAHPQQWPPGTLDALLGPNTVARDVYRHVSAWGLLDSGPGTGHADIDDEFVAQLARLDTGDLTSLAERSAALLPMLDSKEATLGDVITALEVAWGLPVTEPATEFLSDIEAAAAAERRRIMLEEAARETARKAATGNQAGSQAGNETGS